MLQKKITPFSLRDAPSLIESILPVQRLSIDVFKERMAGSGQTLTGLGSYWKGRKPLILNRACILGSLLPATKNPKKDLEIFELLMSMDEKSLRKRLSLKDNQTIPSKSYRQLSSEAKRAEELWIDIHEHIWETVNTHLSTNAKNINDLVEQLGVMRFGRKPVVADTFSGSGQIPFEAARLGCDVIASDLNPIACMLTWGSFHLVASDQKNRMKIHSEQKELAKKINIEMEALKFETNKEGLKAKVYLYCLEVKCPTSGWMVPVLPSLIISKVSKVVAYLEPNKKLKKYDIKIKTNCTDSDLKKAEIGTITRNSKFGEAYVTHSVDGQLHRNSISTIRGDYSEKEDDKSTTKNKLRLWNVHDFKYQSDDIFNDRLYAIQWTIPSSTSRSKTEFREVTKEDLDVELQIEDYVQKHIKEWQKDGWVPDVRIEPGAPPRYEGKSLITNRGWTHWHHLFNPRQLLLSAIIRKHITAYTAIGFINLLNWNAKLSIWNPGNNNVQQVFANQALNPLYNYGCRGSSWIEQHLIPTYSEFDTESNFQVINDSASNIKLPVDIFITDPPYGDAVKYEEILEFFIAWLRKKPPKEFASWVWDSRRALAIKGEDHDFKLSMVSAYKRMAECMPDNGIQVIMFTHQSGAIWADMANIVWASGLQVTAAWYVVTETDSALRDGQYVKGTILLVLRKRLQSLDAARDELAYELAEEVKKQVDLLTGLNKDTKNIYKDENLFEDADLQMAGYAAALRVLTRYKTIDGIDMPQESLRPRIKGQITMVDELIEFAVNIANEYLVPEGMETTVWEKCAGIERLYLKMLDMEYKGIFNLSNYQNFAKAFKVQSDAEIMNEAKANKASLKTAKQLGAKGMNSTDEFGPTVLRSVLYGIHLLEENKTKPDDVLHQLRDLIPNYYRERERIVALANYVYKKTSSLRHEESSNAMVLRDLVRRERV